MPRWKQTLLWAYYYATVPYRGWMTSLESEARRCPIYVLFYHRVADTSPNDWTIPTQTFLTQMEWLSRRFEMISLAEVQTRIRRGFNDRPAVAITFDDGYAENCDVALPCLIERKIPCTYFVATDFVLEQQPFPHDVAAGQPLPTNTPQQIQELAAAGIEIGAHTRTHADLGKVTDVDEICREIIGSQEDLERLTDRKVRYFAFPYGQQANLSQAAFQVAHDAGLEAVCSAYGGYNLPAGDAFHLQRIHGDPVTIRLKNWLTGDPRKTRSLRPYEYDLSATPATAAAEVTR